MWKSPHFFFTYLFKILEYLEYIVLIYSSKFLTPYAGLCSTLLMLIISTVIAYKCKEKRGSKQYFKTQSNFIQRFSYTIKKCIGTLKCKTHNTNTACVPIRTNKTRLLLLIEFT